ncbi:hypothetical protein [Paraburkholderia sp. C35]|uniref:hypothetical protein n=1 Tax=Paraburkholderia sp. C35 TaxID=2126993 RepID=UPI000D69626E|nr:hypothetical protein [Paraburkholderia sp. C35]
MARITTVYKGTLQSLGQGMRNQRGYTVRAITKIGDREIKDLRYSAYLADFIDDSVGDEVELGVCRYLGGPEVIGVRFPDGTVRRDTGSMPFLLGFYAVFGFLFFLCAMGFPRSGLFVTMLPTLFLAWKARKPFKGLRLARTFKPTVQQE